MGAADWIFRGTQRRSAHPAPAERHRRWVVTYSALCIVLLVGFVVLFRRALGLDVLDYGNSVDVAALLGLLALREQRPQQLGGRAHAESASSAARSRGGISTGRRLSRSTKTCTNQPSAAGCSLPARNRPIS